VLPSKNKEATYQEQRAEDPVADAEYERSPQWEKDPGQNESGGARKNPPPLLPLLNLYCVRAQQPVTDEREASASPLV
jgi:hypothetical protein